MGAEPQSTATVHGSSIFEKSEAAGRVLCILKHVTSGRNLVPPWKRHTSDMIGADGLLVLVNVTQAQNSNLLQLSARAMRMMPMRVLEGPGGTAKRPFR